MIDNLFILGLSPVLSPSAAAAGSKTLTRFKHWIFGLQARSLATTSPAFHNNELAS